MYQVQAIIGKKINQKTNKIEYRVKWANYSIQESTWMPEQNLKFVKNLIKKYNEQLEMQVDDIIREQKSKKIKKEVSINYESLMQEQQEDQLVKKIGIYQDDQNEAEKKTNKQSQSQIICEKNREKTTSLSVNQEQCQNQIKYREGSRQSQKKSKIVQKVLNKKPHSQIFVKQQPIKPQDGPKSNGNNIPPIPPDYQNNPHRYIPVEQIQIQQKAGTKINRVNQNIWEEPDRKKGINFWQKHLKKIQQKKKEEKILENYTKNNSRVIPPPPPPRIFTPHQGQFKVQAYQKQERSQYSYRYQVQPLDNFSGSNHEYYYDTTNPTQKDEKNTFFQVYSVLNMQRTPQGFIYLAETNQGRKWLVREDVVPKFSTILVQFYEKHLTFQD